MSRALALVLLLAACGSSETQPAQPAPAADPTPAPTEAGAATDEPADPEWVAKGDQAVALFRKLHGVVLTNKGDCNAMGEGLGSLVDDNEAFITEARAFKADVKFTRWFDRTYGPELAVLVQELGPVLQGCLGNAAVKAAIIRFEGPRKR